MCRKVLITLGVLCFLCAANAKADDIASAYCPLGEGYVFLYDSPAGFQVLANLKCGSKLTVLDARDKDRVKVRTAEGKEGYVLKSTPTAVPLAAGNKPRHSPRCPRTLVIGSHKQRSQSPAASKTTTAGTSPSTGTAASAAQPQAPHSHKHRHSHNYNRSRNHNRR